MALFRLVNRNIGSQLVNKEYQKVFFLSRTVTLKPTPAPECEAVESHDDRNMRLHRPQSPYLSIYAAKLPMVLSGSHRITGCIVGGYGVLLGLGSIALPHPISHYLDALESANIGMPALMVIKFLLAAPLVYHTCNGVRHLVWDTGRFLTRKGVYTTGYVMLACFFASLGGVMALGM